MSPGIPAVYKGLDHHVGSGYLYLPRSRRYEGSIVDYRPNAGVRISPHFYNREQECDFALEQIDEILRTQAWEKHAAASATPA